METHTQIFTQEVIAQANQILAEEPLITQKKLSEQICQHLSWKSANGQLKSMSCRKLLSKLKRQEKVVFCATDNNFAFQKRTKIAKLNWTPKYTKLKCPLSDLGQIEVIPIFSRHKRESEIWNILMNKYHPLKEGPLCGAQMRYLIKSDKYGYIGGLSFSGATWKLKSRDQLIGWTENAHRKNLQLIINNSRFLILPMVQVPHLASHVLGLAARRLTKDWEAKYNYKPVLLETFVDSSQFKGTSYRAANWRLIGETQGRSTPFANGKIPSGKKDIYLYPLCKNWKNILQQEGQKNLILRSNHSKHMADWVENEFYTAEIYDDRLRQRLYNITRDFFAQPGSLVTQASGGSIAKSKAVYRFCANKKINMEILLKSHTEATIERMSPHKIVLVPQDTTTLNYTAHTATEGLGPINTTKDKGTGLVVHDTLAFTAEGTPLGLLDVQVWARNPKEAGKSVDRRKLPIEEKESYKWLKSYQAVAEAQKLCPNTKLISMGDRESDVYELFYEATKAVETTNKPELLIRASRGTNRKVLEDDHNAQRLWDNIETTPVAGYQELYIPRKGSRAARTAKLAISFKEVELLPPKGSKLPKIKLNAVYAKEVGNPNVKAPLEWMLLTTVSVHDFDKATEVLRWYALRWGIEVYHRTLKSGCRIEDRRLNNADKLESCLAIDMVVAWRIYFLTKQGRETPNIPCDVFLSEDEWKALCAYKKKEIPKEPPTLNEATRWIASLGGFLGRKNDGMPGTTTMWRGLQRLQDIVIGFKLFQAIPLQRAGP